MAMKASIGRIVHYRFADGANGSWASDNGQSITVPAIITQVWTDDCVNLTVFVDGYKGVLAVTSAPLKNEHNAESGGYWEWPVINAPTA